MNIIRCSNYEQVSAAAAGLVEAQIRRKPDTVLGLATGDTPLGLYRELVESHRRGELSFAGVTTFNLDEYYPIPRTDSQSYHTFMHKNLFDYIDVPAERIHILNGETADVARECADFEAAIEAAGGLDFQVLGIGGNGHIAFNEPADALEARTHLVDLTEDTIEANARFFATPDLVPRQAMTMGIGTIMKARKIILLACGEKKRRAIEGILTGKITTHLPASLLSAHPDVTIITDLDV